MFSIKRKKAQPIKPKAELSDEHDHIRKEFEKYWQDPKSKNFDQLLTMEEQDSSISKKKDFQVTLNLPEYKPEEVSVTANGNVVEVKGKHQEKIETGEMQTVRSFIKSFNVSEDCDIAQLRSKFEKNGVLTISAPKKS